MTPYRVWYLSEHDRVRRPRYALVTASSPEAAERAVESPTVHVMGASDARQPLPEQGGPTKPWENA